MSNTQNNTEHNTSSNTEVAAQILDIVFKRRKLLESAQVAMVSDLSTTVQSTQQNTQQSTEQNNKERHQHLLKIEQMVSNNQPIHMILPAYPGKSPNRDKTLSKLPDLSEEHSLDNLGQLCQEISQVYSVGAKICICSDGYVFADLVRIPDADVLAYTQAIQAYYQKHYPDYFEFYDIKDCYPQLNCLDSMREELMVGHGESLLTLKAKSQVEKETQSMYKGITKFLFEDFLGLTEFVGQSKTQTQKMAKQVSLRVIQRSNAWSQLLEGVYPGSLRLSIHPQFRESAKIGIKMADSDDCWRTPWHSVAVRKDAQIWLQKRSNIDENKFRLIFSRGKPSHYQQISMA
ncbi:MAG: pyoverdine/dityrosine biosynthesis protein Dit1 [Phenylobacterium sp.]|jgi:pyoverdine/dityrosine biosynthesis protein Dit1